MVRFTARLWTARYTAVMTETLKRDLIKAGMWGEWREAGMVKCVGRRLEK